VTIRVLIVDDHAVVRSGLRRVLDAEPDIETVAEAPDAERAVFEAIENKPDVVLLDVMMPGKTGIEGMPALLQAVPDAKMLVLSMQDDPRYVREAFDAGASGYVLKEAADTEVVGAIRAVAAGERYVHPSLGAKHTHEQLLFRHFKTENADILAFLYRDMLGHVQGESRFSHGRPRGDDHEISRLQTRGHAIKVRKSGRNSGDQLPFGIEFFQQPCGGHFHLFYRDEAGLDALFR